ncbi:hypothetical protein HYH03_018458 [Edaphochlamys debaryana]|uniref:Carboxypeptidase n=1 Tax=Edaphochlamys debaryana TaxID=47281 RepID=A0A835XK85_9CHLO|nr:hypothetical protein HYH03_018458 [Edaphochlamys debaryana]|eukprot:KAG2482615.1 hypothetical protein HYH03_018458 [Edaphochlamys debaryana]
MKANFSQYPWLGCRTRPKPPPLACALPALLALILLANRELADAARPRVGTDPLGLAAEAAKALRALEAPTCGDAPDDVCALPGLNGIPHVRMRSGYVTVSEPSGRKLWYLVADRETQQPSTEAEAEGEAGVGKGGRKNDDQASPVVLWLTGGPGCSSLDAFIYEHGPFSFSNGVNGDIFLSPNPYSWTKAATMIYVDSPAGAGLSYSNDTEDYKTNDEYTIIDLVRFLEGLTARYPELATAPFFITGESYGGVYVPLLATALVKANKKRSGEGQPPLVNLQGYAIGNGVTDEEADGNAPLHFAAGMGFLDPGAWRRLREACGDAFWNATKGSKCTELMVAAREGLKGMNPYNVLDPCTASPKPAPGLLGLKAPADPYRLLFWPYAPRMEGHPDDGPSGRRLWGPGLRHVAPCMDRRIAMEWLGREEVRSALHAAPVRDWNWQPCSDIVHYDMVKADMAPLHEALVREGLRALVYTGDHDMVVPHTGTRAWLFDKADLGGVEQPLRPWLMGGQVVGFTARFKAGSRLTFASVKGAGHMVPQSKPAEALYLFEAFLNNQDL